MHQREIHTTTTRNPRHDILKKSINFGILGRNIPNTHMHNLEDELTGIKEDMMFAVIEEDEALLANLQKRHDQIERLLMGEGPIA
jgi:hypothetical protein